MCIELHRVTHSRYVEDKLGLPQDSFDLVDTANRTVIKPTLPVGVLGEILSIPTCFISKCDHATLQVAVHWHLRFSGTLIKPS